MKINHKIQGYPSFLLVKDNNNAIEYNSGRKYADFNSFIKKNV